MFQSFWLSCTNKWCSLPKCVCVCVFRCPLLCASVGLRAGAKPMAEGTQGKKEKKEEEKKSKKEKERSIAISCYSTDFPIGVTTNLNKDERDPPLVPSPHPHPIPAAGRVCDPNGQQALLETRLISTCWLQQPGLVSVRVLISAD